VELINSVPYLERAHGIVAARHGNAISGPSKATMPILINLLASLVKAYWWCDALPLTRSGQCL